MKALVWLKSENATVNSKVFPWDANRSELAKHKKVIFHLPSPRLHTRLPAYITISAQNFWKGRQCRPNATEGPSVCRQCCNTPGCTENFNPDTKAEWKANLMV